MSGVKGRSGRKPARRGVALFRVEEVTRRSRIKEATKRKLARVPRLLAAQVEAEAKRGVAYPNQFLLGDHHEELVPHRAWVMPCPQCGGPPIYGFCQVCTPGMVPEPFAWPVVSLDL